MRRVRWNSVRVRLTLWNALLMALMLTGSGIALCYRVQADLMRSVDRDLVQGADDNARWWAHQLDDRRRDMLRPRVLTLQGKAVGEGWFARDQPWDWKTLALSAAGASRLSTVRIDGEPLRVYSRPFVRNGRVENVIQIAHPLGAPDLLRSVDRDLVDGAEGMARDWARQLDERSHRPREDTRHPFGRRPRPPGSRPPPGPRPPATDAERRKDLLRPRVLTLQGKAVDTGWFAQDHPWDWKTLAVAATGDSRFSTVQLEGEALRVYSRPFIRNGKAENVIQIAHPLGDLERVSQEQIDTLLTLIPLALLLAGFFGIVITDRTLRPVRQITQAAAQIGAEDLSQRLEVRGQDEFGELAGTFNGMISRLELAFTRVESAYRSLEHAYEQQRRFTADASHELRTPLTRIKGSASLALDAPRTAPEYCKALKVINDAADVMNRLVRDLLLLARADADPLRLDQQPVSLTSLFERAASAIPEKAGPSLRFERPNGPLAVQGHPDSLVRVLTNLIENAIRHTPETGRITLSAREQGDEVVITIADTGEGIPAEHLPHVCERFYRVDAARSRAQGGSGLGLAICQTIVRSHGGKLEIESEVGRGTTVRVTLPRAELPAPEREGMAVPA